MRRRRLRRNDDFDYAGTAAAMRLGERLSIEEEKSEGMGGNALDVVLQVLYVFTVSNGGSAWNL